MVVYVGRVLIDLVAELGRGCNVKEAEVRIQQLLHERREEFAGETSRILGQFILEGDLNLLFLVKFLSMYVPF